MKKFLSGFVLSIFLVNSTYAFSFFGIDFGKTEKEISGIKDQYDSIKGQVDSAKDQIDSIRGEVDKVGNQINEVRETFGSVDTIVDEKGQSISDPKVEEFNALPDSASKFAFIEGLGDDISGPMKSTLQGFTNEIQTEIDTTNATISTTRDEVSALKLERQSILDAQAARELENTKDPAEAEALLKDEADLQQALATVTQDLLEQDQRVQQAGRQVYPDIFTQTTEATSSNEITIAPISASIWKNLVAALSLINPDDSINVGASTPTLSDDFSLGNTDINPTQNPLEDALSSGIRINYDQEVAEYQAAIDGYNKTREEEVQQLRVLAQEKEQLETSRKQLEASQKQIEILAENNTYQNELNTLVITEDRRAELETLVAQNNEKIEANKTLAEPFINKSPAEIQTEIESINEQIQTNESFQQISTETINSTEANKREVGLQLVELKEEHNTAIIENKDIYTPAEVAEASKELKFTKVEKTNYEAEQLEANKNQRDQTQKTLNQINELEDLEKVQSPSTEQQKRIEELRTSTEGVSKAEVSERLQEQEAAVSTQAEVVQAANKDALDTRHQDNQLQAVQVDSQIQNFQDLDDRRELDALQSKVGPPTAEESARIAELEERVGDKNTADLEKATKGMTLEELQQEKEILTNSTAAYAAEQELAKAGGELSETQQKLQSTLDTRKALENEREELLAKKDTLEKQKESGNCNEACQKDLDRLETINTDIAKKEGEIETLTAEAATLKEKIAEVKTELAGLACEYKSGNEVRYSANGYCVQLSEPIGNVKSIRGANGIDLFKTYVGIIYKYTASIVGLIAVFVIVISGLQITMAGMNAELASSAKSRIMQALMSLALIFLIGVILKTVNPNFFKQGVTTYHPPTEIEQHIV